MQTNIDLSRLFKQVSNNNNNSQFQNSSSDEDSQDLKKMSIKDLLFLIWRMISPQQWGNLTYYKFRDYSKRFRIVLVSLLMPLILFIIKLWQGETTILMMILTSFFIAILMYILTLWALKFEIVKESWFMSILYPSLFIFSVNIALQLFFSNNLDNPSQRILYTIIMFIISVSLYILLLTMNIINVNLFHYLPLINSTYTSLFMMILFQTLVILFVCIFLAQQSFIYSLIFLSLASIILFAIVSIFIRLCLYSWNKVLLLSTAIIFCVIYSIIILSFFHISILVISLSGVCIIYVALHMILHHTKMMVKDWFKLEYLFIFLTFFLIFFLDLVNVLRIWL